MKVMGTGTRRLIINPGAAGVYAIAEGFILEMWEYLEGDMHLITGMAEGWDELIAKVGLNNKIPYHAYVPNKGYGKYYWGKRSLLRRNRLPTYEKLLDGAARVIYVAGNDLYVNGEHANFVRNRRMIADSDMALVYREKGHYSRGTEHCLKHIIAAGLHYEEFPFNVQGKIF